MSTTTCLQLEGLQKKTPTFHRYIFSEPQFSHSEPVKEENKNPASKSVESRQKVLLLKGVREQYTLVEDHTIPSTIRPGEILVKVSRL